MAFETGPEHGIAVVTLGTWQGIFLWEHRVRPHRRQIAMHLLGEIMTTAHLPRRRLLGLSFVFLWFFVGGLAHFAETETKMRIVPPYVPWPREAVLVSGVFELVGRSGSCGGRRVEPRELARSS